MKVERVKIEKRERDGMKLTAGEWVAWVMLVAGLMALGFAIRIFVDGGF